MLYPLSHFELDSGRGVALFTGHRRAGALQALQEPRQARHRMGPREDVQVRHDHPDLEEVGSLFARHLAQEPAEEAR